MADAKLQVVRTTLDADYVDMRDEKFVGAPVDNHRTFAEKRILDTDADKFLALATRFNRIIDELDEYIPDVAGKIATVLGLEGVGKPTLRARLYNND